MKAIIYTKYGPPDVLKFKEVEKPTPGNNEVLVKVFATTVNRTDSATIRAIPFFARIITGLLKPKKQTPGTEFAGEIEEIGKRYHALVEVRYASPNEQRLDWSGMIHFAKYFGKALRRTTE